MEPAAPDNVVPLRPVPRRSRFAQWPIIVVLAGVGIAMLLIALDYFRRGSIVLSASVLIAAFLRLLLPESEAGLLAVRSRRIDVITLLVLGVGLTIFTFWGAGPELSRRSGRVRGFAGFAGSRVRGAGRRGPGAGRSRPPPHATAPRASPGCCGRGSSTCSR